MTSVQINLASPSSSKSRMLYRLLGAFTLRRRRHAVLDISAMSDHLRRDIGLAPADIALASDIMLLNVNIRSGIIFPRPC